MHLDDWISERVPEHTIHEASAWIIQQAQGSLDPEASAAFNDWLADDPMHTWTYEELSLLWAKLNTLPEHEVEFLQSKVFVLPTPTHRAKSIKPSPTIHTDNILSYCIIGILCLAFLVKMF